jgi:hypothetical protein
VTVRASNSFSEYNCWNFLRRTRNPEARSVQRPHTHTQSMLSWVSGHTALTGKVPVSSSTSPFGSREGGETRLIGTPVSHVQAVLSHSLNQLIASTKAHTRSSTGSRPKSGSRTCARALAADAEAGKSRTTPPRFAPRTGLAPPSGVPRCTPRAESWRVQIDVGCRALSRGGGNS